MTQAQYDAQLTVWVAEAETTLAKRELDPAVALALVKAMVFEKMNARVAVDPEFEEAMCYALANRRPKTGAESESI